MMKRDRFDTCRHLIDTQAMKMMLAFMISLSADSIMPGDSNGSASARLAARLAKLRIVDER